MTRLLAPLTAALVLSFAHAAPEPKKDKDPVQEELAKLDGTWKVTSVKVGGVELLGDKDAPEMLVTFKGGAFSWNDESAPGKVAAIDPSKTPKQITYEYTGGEDKGKKHHAIYKLDGDTFTDCFGEHGAACPTEFKSTEANGLTLMTYKRHKRVD